MPKHEALARVIAQAAGEHDPGFEPWHYEEAAVVIAAAMVEFLTSDEAFARFVDSFNGDAAGDIDFVFSQLGDTGYAMRGGNDVRAVFNKALLAAVGGSDE